MPATVCHFSDDSLHSATKSREYNTRMEAASSSIIKKVTTFSPDPLRKSEKNKRRRAVAFNDKVLVRKTLHLNDYTDEEFDNSFFNDFDYSDIQEMFSITKQLLDLGEEEDEDAGICYRGVEDQLEEEIECRRQSITELRDSVISEQQNQSRRGLIDGSQYLAYLCRAITIRSVQKAIAKARQDEAYVFKG